MTLKEITIKFWKLSSLFINNILNCYGNLNRLGPKPKMADIQIIALAITSEYLSIDSENLLFKKISSCHKNDFPNLI